MFPRALLGLFARPIAAHAVKVTLSFASGAAVAIAAKRERERLQAQRKQAILAKPLATFTKISEKTQLGIYETKYKKLNPHLKHVLMDGYQFDWEQVKGLLVAMDVYGITAPQISSISVHSTRRACNWLYDFAQSVNKLELKDDDHHARALKGLAEAIIEHHAEVKKRYQINEPEKSEALSLKLETIGSVSRSR